MSSIHTDQGHFFFFFLLIKLPSDLLFSAALICLPVIPSFVSFFSPLSPHSPARVCLPACLGSDSAQKAGLQPRHVSLWLQGQYQTCPWGWQCKYRWSRSRSHTLLRVDPRSYANAASSWMPNRNQSRLTHISLIFSPREAKGNILSLVFCQKILSFREGFTLQKADEPGV